MAKIAVGMCAAAGLALLAPAARADDDPFWGRDKAAHFVVSSALAAGGYALGTALWPQRSRAMALGVGTALAAGALKEAWDATGRGDPSWKDFAWDGIGAVFGVGLSFAVDVGAHGGTARLAF